LVLGSGVGGLSAAVRAATRPGLRVGVLTKAELHQSATRWAQGGIAAVLGDEADSTDLHLADTLAAGAGLCDVDAVRVLVDEGPTRVHELIAMGAVFDTDTEGRLDLAREGGHSKARIVHAGGVATGAEIERALVEAVRATAAVVLEGWFALELLVEGGRCRGVVALDPTGVRHEVRAAHTLLATGGAGQLFWVTTNPREATGDGIAMGLRAGVAVSDVEFMQFHPTALHHPAMPRPLLSEALRGHGAVLRDMAGERFIDELLPRDQVSRAMTTRMLRQDADHLWLDATGLDAFGQRFPTIAAALADVGLDPTTDWLPIAPAAHYLSGGVLTDLDGATSLPGLWACGEVACTGVHGANRLASNSLLEGMVFAPRVVEAIDAGREGPEATGAMAALAGSGGRGIAVRPVERTSGADDLDITAVSGEGGTERRRVDLQLAMTRGAGVVRTASSLRTVLDSLTVPAGTSAATAELSNLATLGRALVAAALQRTESRGNHWRADHEDLDPRFAVRLVHNLP
jgi:L-aspartate oxidase